MKKIVFLIMLFMCELSFAAEYEEIKFNSVNTCTSVVNYNPQLSPVGATEINQKPHIRKVNVNDDPGDPFASPIGDISLSMFLFATSYTLYKRNKLKFL